jgi:hypothetical protein
MLMGYIKEEDPILGLLILQHLHFVIFVVNIFCSMIFKNVLGGAACALLLERVVAKPMNLRNVVKDNVEKRSEYDEYDEYDERAASRFLNSETKGE